MIQKDLTPHIVFSLTFAVELPDVFFKTRCKRGEPGYQLMLFGELWRGKECEPMLKSQIQTPDITKDYTVDDWNNCCETQEIIAEYTTGGT